MAAGLLKPGLNTILAPKESSRPKTNNIDGLKQKHEELHQKLPWIERLDMVNKPAPLAPELGKWLWMFQCNIQERTVALDMSFQIQNFNIDLFICSISRGATC